MDFREDDFGVEQGSDELLADDFLHLPENANPLVRIHAVRAWLRRRVQEAEIEIGEAALALQAVQMEEPAMRRREREQQSERQQQFVHKYEQTLEHLKGFQDAENLLEENIAHVTSGERTLVEYYLSLEESIQELNEEKGPAAQAQRMALAEVQHRVEHVGIPEEE